MSYITLCVAAPLESRVTIAQLSLILRTLRYAEWLCAVFVITMMGIFIMQRTIMVSPQHSSATAQQPALVLVESVSPDTVSGSSNQSLSAISTADDTAAFSLNNQQLDAILLEWATKYPGLNVSASFQELGGQARHAEYRGTQTVGSASIYKLYLATYLYQQVEAGKLTLESGTATGKTINQCIEAMLLVSDNPCGEELGAKVGWTKLNAYVKTIGLTGSKLNVSPLQSSANDSALFLNKLQTGQLLNSQHTASMLAHMSHQVIRGGIPAGSMGAAVVNRVGYDGSVWNDAAIVHGTNGSYVLSVYTSARNALVVNDLAQRISQALDKE